MTHSLVPAVAGIADQKHDRAIAVAIPFEFLDSETAAKCQAVSEKLKTFTGCSDSLLFGWYHLLCLGK
jgi:hypothetical protein